jgi:Uma2 family endonuclease
MEIPVIDLIEEFQSEDIMSLNHSRIINRVCIALDQYDDEYDIFPELELELPMGKCKPDVAIYQNLPTDWFNDIIFFKQPPVIAIEILSPKQGISDLTDKAFKVYFPSGVQTVWLIIPTLRLAQILLPDNTLLTWSSGRLKDPNTGIELDLDYLFR